MRNNLIFGITILIILIWNSHALSLQKDTHKAINEHIGQNTVNYFSLRNYLRHNLEFKEGFNEVLKGYDANGNSISQKVFQWLGNGGEQEDRPGSILDYIQHKPTRSVNHFHNPLKALNEAGLNDILGLYTGQSSVLWSQNPNQHIGGKWSWKDARDYFYSALTSANRTRRDDYFAKTFRAVGQLMHLVEDASGSDPHFSNHLND